MFTVAVALLCVIVAARRCGKSDLPMSRSGINEARPQTGQEPRPTDETPKPSRMQWQPTSEEQKVIDSTEAVFFGKVVDQDGSPVPNTEIVIQPNHDPWVVNLRRRTMTADSNGLFTITEPNAASLSVSIPAPPGYYSTKESGGSFGFADLPASLPASLRAKFIGPTKTSAASPHVFVLKKMASRDPLLARTGGGPGKLKEHQTYQVGTNPDQRVDIKFWFDPEVKRMVRGDLPMHDWGVEITVVNGGLFEAKRPQSEISEQFLAPENGYQPTLRFSNDSLSTDEKVTWHYHTHFFVKFSDNTYARVEASFEPPIERPNAGKPRASWSIESWYNPSGRRSLEYDHTMRIQEPSR